MESLRTDCHPLGSKGLQAASQMLSALPPVGLGILEAGSKHGQWARCVSWQAKCREHGPEPASGQQAAGKAGN